MGFQADYNEHDYEFSCPECGSPHVSLKTDEHGLFEIAKCKKCGYKKDSEKKSE
jgi:transcription elongation factor Elf1